MMVPIKPPTAWIVVRISAPSFLMRSGVKSNPISGPRTGSTVATAVMSVPQMVIDSPHHFGCGTTSDWAGILLDMVVSLDGMRFGLVGRR